jgi:hypothetical protein
MYSGIYCRIVHLKSTYDTDEYIASIFRAEKYAKDETAQKWAPSYLFITTAIRTSNPTIKTNEFRCFNCCPG